MTLSKERIEAIEGADEKLAEITARIKRSELHENESICFKTNEASELLTLVTALSAKLKEVEGELKKIRSVIPMNFLIAHDTPGATGPTDALDLVGAIRSLVHNARKWEERARSALSAKQQDDKDEIARLNMSIELLSADKATFAKAYTDEKARADAQKAAHAKMLRDEAPDWRGHPIAGVLRSLADKIEGGE